MSFITIYKLNSINHGPLLQQAMLLVKCSQGLVIIKTLKKLRCRQAATGY